MSNFQFLAPDFTPQRRAGPHAAGQMVGMQSLEASRLLQGLVRAGYLESHNPGRGAVYCLPGAALPTPEDVFGNSSAHLPVSSGHLNSSSGHLSSSSGHLSPSSGHLAGSSGHLEQISAAGDEKNIFDQRDRDGRLLPSRLDAPVIDALAHLQPDFRTHLESLAREARATGKLDKKAMHSIILAICTGHYITGTAIAELVNRDAEALRKHHLRPLIQQGSLRLAFPTAPTHKMQAYRTTESE